MAQDPRLERLFKNLDAVADILREDHIDNERVEEAKKLAQDWIRAYEDGKLYYSRDILVSIEEQLKDVLSGKDDGRGMASIEDALGKVRQHSILVPEKLKRHW